MGAKTWILAYATPGKSTASILESIPTLDRTASVKLAKRLFPSFETILGEDVSLNWACPQRGEALVGCFQDLTLVSTPELAKDPRELPERFMSAAAGRDIYVHVMRSTVDWFAFAVWRDGKLVRFLSVCPDSGLEEVGERMEFELPFWAGDFPIDPDNDDEEYPLPFHPLEMGESALQTFFGFWIEGGPQEFSPTYDASTIRLPRFKRPKFWWKLW